MTTHAVIKTRKANLWTSFGLDMAIRYFGEDVIDTLPRFSNGTHKGQIKAQITWQKVEKGGWVGSKHDGHVERRVGMVISCVLTNLPTWAFRDDETGTIIETWKREKEKNL